jgi:peptidoglycan/xylan/chitin deacetylase (PgdA/CDA1 family)
MLVELAIVLGLVAGVAGLIALPLRPVRPALRAAMSLTVALLVVGLGTWHLSRARWQLFGETFSRLDTDERVVALTFDDGPSPRWTEAVLEMLHREGVRGTFFLIGESVDEHPELARAIVQAGHEVGNHSYSHKRMVLHSPGFVRTEVERTDAALRRAGWQGQILFRSPFCKKLVVLPHYLARNGRVNVFWDVEADSGDAARDASRMVSRVLSQTKAGSVILMHVMYDARAASREALPSIVRGLRVRGFEFVTLSELMRRRK